MRFIKILTSINLMHYFEYSIKSYDNNIIIFLMNLNINGLVLINFIKTN